MKKSLVCYSFPEIVINFAQYTCTVLCIHVVQFLLIVTFCVVNFFEQNPQLVTLTIPETL